MKTKNDQKTMAQLTAGYEEFIKGKKTNKKGKTAFKRIIKKAAKLRGSK